jgi:hypothetical protein
MDWNINQKNINISICLRLPMLLTMLCFELYIDNVDTKIHCSLFTNACQLPLNCIAWMTYTILCWRTCWIVCKKTHINFRLDDVLDFILIFEWLLKLWHLSQFLSFFSLNQNFAIFYIYPSYLYKNNLRYCHFHQLQYQ